MALTTTSNKVIHSGNGATTVWPFSFPVPNATYLSVILTSALGVETTLASSLYSVTGIGVATGGNVTYPLSGSPIAAGTTLTLLRTVPLSQTTQLANQGGYFPEVVEIQLDLLTMEIQQVDEKVGRAYLTAVSGVAPQDASAYSVGTLADMKALTARPLTVIMEGYTAAGDGGGGLFWWDAGSTTTANDGTVVTPTSGVAGRYKRLVTGPTMAQWFGATVTATTLQAAIDSLPADGGEVILPAGRIALSAKVTAGNGSNAAASTRNCVKLRGVGPAPYFGTTYGTELYWTGAAGGTMLEYAGSGDGFGLDGVEINGMSSAAYGLVVYSVRTSHFINFTVRDCTNTNILLAIRTGGGIKYAANNLFANWISTSLVEGCKGIAISGDFAGNNDWHRNTLIDGISQVIKASAGTSYAAYLGFSDHNVWLNCDLNVYGSGTGYGLAFDATGNTAYPENDSFYGCSISSTIAIEPSTDRIGFNFFWPFTTRDGEVVPTHAKLIGITDAGELFGGPGSMLDREISAATVVSSTTETTVFTKTLVANAMRTTLALNYSGSGVVYNATGSAVTYRLRIYFGGTVILDTTAVSVASDAATRITQWRAELVAGNSAAVQYCQASAVIGGVDTAAGSAIAPHTHVLSGAILTIDTTAAAEFKATIQMGTSSANAQYLAWTGLLELK